MNVLPWKTRHAYPAASILLLLNHGFVAITRHHTTATVVLQQTLLFRIYAKL
jgi:hypothetical protein